MLAVLQRNFSVMETKIAMMDQMRMPAVRLFFLLSFNIKTKLQSHKLLTIKTAKFKINLKS